MVSWLYTSLSASLPDWLQSRFAALRELLRLRARLLQLERPQER